MTRGWLPRPVAAPQEAVGAVVGMGGALLLSALFVPLRGDLSNANAALVLVLPVMAGAVVGGRWAGGAAALTAAMCFDFFFTRPYLSLRITSGDDIETALILLVVSMVAAELAIRSRRRRHEATEAQSDLARLRRVADVAARGSEPEDVVLSVRAEMMGLLGLDDCRYERDATAVNDVPYLGRGGEIHGASRVYRDRGFDLPSPIAVPVVGRGRTLGALVLTAPPATPASLEQRVVAVALADELGIVLAGAPAGSGEDN